MGWYSGSRLSPSNAGEDSFRRRMLRYKNLLIFILDYSRYVVLSTYGLYDKYKPPPYMLFVGRNYPLSSRPHLHGSKLSPLQLV